MQRIGTGIRSLLLTFSKSFFSLGAIRAGLPAGLGKLPHHSLELVVRVALDDVANLCAEPVPQVGKVCGHAAQPGQWGPGRARYIRCHQQGGDDDGNEDGCCTSILHLEKLAAHWRGYRWRRHSPWWVLI